MKRTSGHISSETLVNLYRQGNSEALKMLIKRHHSEIISTVSYYTNSRMSADDLAQECWIDIIRKLPELELKISFKAWVHAIAKRRSVDWIREQQRMRKRNRVLQSETAKTGELDEVPEPADEIDKIRAGLLKLPASKRIVLRMFYLENLSLREISKVLEIPEGTIKSRLFHARENLKEMINSKNEESQ